MLSCALIRAYVVISQYDVSIISSCHTIFNRTILLFHNGKYESRSAGCCSVSIFESNVSSDWKFVVVVEKLCNFMYLLSFAIFCTY